MMKRFSPSLMKRQTCTAECENENILADHKNRKNLIYNITNISTSRLRPQPQVAFFRSLPSSTTRRSSFTLAVVSRNLT